MPKKLALLACASLLAVLTCEVALRVLYHLRSTGDLADLRDDRPLPEPGALITMGHILERSPDPGIVYRGRAGIDGVFGGTRVRTNQAGWREDEIPFAKPAGTFRIVGIGDSVMFGWKVEEHERYLDLLERRLNRERPERHWQTVALAMPGYNLMIELEMLKRHGLNYQPDLVVYGYLPNDLCLPTFVAERLDVLAPHSFLAYYVRQGLKLKPKVLGRHEAVTGPLNPGRGDRPYCDGKRIHPQYRHLMGPSNFRRALDELARLSVDTGIPTVVMHDGRNPDSSLPYDLPGNMIRIDLTAHFERSMREMGISTYRHPQLRIGGADQPDHHPSATSHRIIAEGLFEHLKREGLLE